MRGIGMLPYSAYRGIGACLGLLVQCLPLKYVRIARRNIELCLPELSIKQREHLVRRHCRSLGIGLCETALTWWGSDRRISKLATIDGMENLKAALAHGRGVILVGGHFTTIEIATRILATVVPMNALYRPPKNEVLARTMYASFCRHGKPIRTDDVRSMIRALKNNEAVWYAPDQSYRNKGAAMVDFFGIPAATTTATSRLAKISGAKVLTYFPERLPHGGYRVTIGAPLQDFPSGDCIEDVKRFNCLLQAHIRKVPEQYLWMHRRFKGMSQDYPRYYGRDSRNRPAPAAVK